MIKKVLKIFSPLCCLIFFIACQPSKLEIIGGVVPHHDLANQEIQNFWLTLSQETKIKTLILISPDHQNLGAKPISLADDRTLFNPQPKLANELIKKLSQNQATAIDNQAFKNEHGIKNHLNYIHQFLPQAELAPIIIRGNATYSEIKNMLTTIKTSLTTQTAIVASLDFSHYQNREQADKFDLETLETLQTYNYQRLWTFGSEHLDSKHALMLVSGLVCPGHNCQWQIIYKGNSADYPGQNPQITTSYFSLFLQP